MSLGAGSVPLLPVAALAEAIATVAAADAPRAVVNNLHSSDWLVGNCAAAIAARPGRLPSDNALGWVLKTEGGVNVTALPPRTPARGWTLTRPPTCCCCPRRCMAARGRRWPPSCAPTRTIAAGGSAAGRRLFTPGGQVALIGRVGLGRVGACGGQHASLGLRVFSEERGMSASGRLAAGQVKSVVGAHLQRLGPPAFFDDCSQMTEAALYRHAGGAGARRGFRPSAPTGYSL